MTNQLTVSTPMAATEIALRLDAHAHAARGALSDQTIRAIRSDSAIWSAWCADRHLSPVPADAQAVANFIDQMGEIKSPATVRRYTATLAHMHRAAGVPDPTKTELVKLALKRVARAKGTRQRQAAGLVDRTVAQIEAVAAKTPAGLRNVALVQTMRDLLLRRSEAAALQLADIAFADDGSGTAIIRRSKTDQTGEGAVRWLSPKTCSAIKAWLAAANIVDGPLFRAVRKDGVVKATALEPGEISRLLKNMAASVGIDPALVSGHSCRVGMAQDLIGAGADLAGVMQAGRWKSAAMPARYGEHLLAGRGAVARYYQRRG